jgi:hypothetical protein
MRSQESWELRLKVLAKYGSVCTCRGCGCDTPEFLTIDHLHNDGDEERKRTKKRGSPFYRELLNSPRRADLRILCSNCHLAITWGDACPHAVIPSVAQENPQQTPMDIAAITHAVLPVIRRDCDGRVQQAISPALGALQQRLDAVEQRLPLMRTPRPWRWKAGALVLVGLVSAVLGWSWW